MTLSRLTLFSSLLFSLMLLSCKDDSAQQAQEPAAADTGAKTILLPMQGERPAGFDSSNAGTFQKIVYREYAGRALGVSKRVSDSILDAVITKPGAKGDIQNAIQTAMQAHLDRQDSIARAELAGKYTITVDSVEAILKIGKAEKW